MGHLGLEQVGRVWDASEDADKIVAGSTTANETVTTTEGLWEDPSVEILLSTLIIKVSNTIVMMEHIS